MKVRELIEILQKAHPDAEVEMEIVLRRSGGFTDKSKSAFGEVHNVLWDPPDKPPPSFDTTYRVKLLEKQGRTGANSLASRQ